jgi:uncharacterized phiE125 gp8 family phage protein
MYRTPIGVYELVTAPAVEPVSLTDVKDHARIDGASEDCYLEGLIVAARELVERTTGRSLITQTWRLTLDDWPGGNEEWWDGVREGPISMLNGMMWVEIRKSPMLAITSVVTKDEAGTPTTWDAGNYYLAKQPNGYGRLTRKQGQTWPVVVDRYAGAIEITFTAGYGATATAVPHAIRHAIKLAVAHWYEHREPASACASASLMPMGLGTLLASYRVAR